jgi:hypothetical protein
MTVSGYEDLCVRKCESYSITALKLDAHDLRAVRS